VFKTRMTELFGIKHPIMLAGMNWVTQPKLVSAVCNAGGLGILAVGSTPPEKARENLRQIRELTDKPFGINQTLNAPGARAKIEVAIEEKVSVINYALGKPWFTEQVHQYGGKIIGTVALVKHAVSAAKLGCDAVVITGHEAAGHGADATSLILIPLCADSVKIPIIAAGGFFDGRGLASALVLGASGISMGTRFAMTQESSLHENYRKLILEATEEDTLYSDAFDGMPSRVLKTEEAEAILRSRRSPVLRSVASILRIKQMLGLSWPELLASAREMRRAEPDFGVRKQLRRATHIARAEKGIFQGDERHGIMPCGQSQGGIHDVPSCAELIERTVLQAKEALETARKLGLYTQPADKRRPPLNQT